MLRTNCLVHPNKRPVAWSEIKLLILDCDGVLTDGRIVYGNGGLDIKNFHASDGMGFMLLKAANIPVAIVTGRSSEALSYRCRDLGIELLFQNVANKLQCVTDLLEKLGLSFDDIVYMGDDWNDIPCMQRAAFSVAPANALPEIQKIADHTTETAGGLGAVRECISYILHKKGIYERAVMDFLEGIC